MKYLVVRSDALQNAGNRMIRHSDYWPCIVEADSPDDAVREAYSQFFGSETRLPVNRPFTVIPTDDGCEVTFRPIQNYTVERRPLY